MSTDFSGIKPVGSTGCRADRPTIRQKAREVRQFPTELPVSAKLSRQPTRARLCRALRFQRRSCSISNQVVIDRDAASIVYQVVDNRTSEVVP